MKQESSGKSVLKIICYSALYITPIFWWAGAENTVKFGKVILMWVAIGGVFLIWAVIKKDQKNNRMNLK
jgi:hypothetical protein